MLFLSLQYHHLVADEKYPHIVYVDKGENGSVQEETSLDAETIKYDLEGLSLSHISLKNHPFIYIAFISCAKE